MAASSGPDDTEVVSPGDETAGFRAFGRSGSVPTALHVAIVRIAERDPRAKPPSAEIGYYATSLAAGELNDGELLDVIRGHWSAIENGVHYRRDVSFGEDASRVAQRSAAHALASLRNLAIGLYEIQNSRGRVEVNGCKSWRRRMTVAMALKLLRS